MLCLLHYTVQTVFILPWTWEGRRARGGSFGGSIPSTASAKAAFTHNDHNNDATATATATATDNNTNNN